MSDAPDTPLILPYMVVETDSQHGYVIDRATGEHVTDVLPLNEAQDIVYDLHHDVPRIPPRAREMHEQGYSFGAIARELGIPVSRASKIVTALRAEGKTERSTAS